MGLFIIDVNLVVLVFLRLNFNGLAFFLGNLCLLFGDKVIKFGVPMDNLSGVVHWHILVKKKSPTHLDSRNHKTITEPEYGVYRLESRVSSIGIIGAQGE